MKIESQNAELYLVTKRWKLVLLSLALCWGVGACILEKIPLEDRRCGPNGECLEGWSCINTLCVKNGSAEVIPTETPQDTKTEEIGEAPPELPIEVPKEQPAPEDGGVVPEVVEEKKPDEPTPGPNCDLFTKTPQTPSCTKDTNLSCYKIEVDKGFTESPKPLPAKLAGAAAVTDGESPKTVNTDTPKVYIYVAGGGDNGVAGSDVYVTELDRDGVLLGWTKTSGLLTARTNASAFIVDGYLIVAGGEGAGNTPIAEIERAKIKADGTLEPFQAVGKLSSVRKGMGITYRHGFFYTAGGEGNAGAATTVERTPLLTDGTLGTTKALSSVQQLPEGKSGALTSNHFSLYFLSKADGKIFLAPIQGNSDLRGWCETTPTPGELKSSQVLLNSRIMILYGLEKTSGSLDARVFISALKPGTGTPRGGGVQPWICSDADSVKAVLTRPRKQAAAVVARGLLYVIGGVDASGTTLASVESVPLPFQGTQCDLDADGTTNFNDTCPTVYNPQAKNLCDESMRLVPAGTFQRGDGSTDTPTKTISLDSFKIDATEVTNAAYQACVKDTVCTEPGKDPVAGITDYYTNDQYKDFPVVHVSWKQALAYCQWVGKRLPTEAEWEKAARGLTTFPYPWGEDSPTCQKANIGTCPTPLPVAVKQFAPGRSPYGVDDMSGNVREWVVDFFDQDYFKNSKETDNPKGPNSGAARAIKSSSFKSSGADAFKISKRGSAKEDFQAEDLGFRCAVSVFPTAP